MATSFNVNVNDLQFILKQIQIAEDHAAGKTLLQAIMDAYGTTAANAAQLPAGLRTVDGSLNNLVLGQENFGAADQVFPRLLTPVYTNELDEAAFQGIINTNYGTAGNVVDSDPRTISNLIVNMTAANPAAVMAALQHSVFSEAILPSQVAAAAAAIATAYGLTQGQPDPVLRAEAEAALTALLEGYGIGQGPEGSLVIPNLSPDIGLSPGFNAWMTFFGQFFDHGLDLVTKGGNGTVYVPLAADDPLIAGADNVFGTADDLPARLRFMAITRLTTAIDLNGDGDTLDAGETGITQGQNTTTSFVDQNQTYTSIASHQVFLREYATVGGKTVSTGRLLDGQTANGSLNGAIGNWAEVKANALQFLGIELTDYDVGNVPWLRTDAYGKFIADPVTGYAQVITGVGLDGKINTADDIVVSGTPAAPVNLAAVGALGTKHAFLNDISHHATPGFVDTNHNGVQDVGEVVQVADFNMLDANRDGLSDALDVAVLGVRLTDANGDLVIDALDLADVNLDGTIDAKDLVADDRNALTYDDEMLNAHFATGDGRGNENIALTTVHSIFHSEHNRLVEANKATLIENATTPAGLAFLNEWLTVDVAAVPADLSTLVWDGERLFQAARFATEMQYQHLVFEEFARRMQPMVDPFIFNNSPDVDPSIVAEFAHTVYRFGHSMLTDTVDRLTNDLDFVGGTASQETLIAAFLNPQMYLASGATLAEANANIIRGLTRELGNEIDEFVVPALQSNLLGLPLDLPAINIARGRDAGIPSLNEARAQLYNDFGIVDLKPYASWKEFGLAIKNPLSVINFIAAYGTHDTVVNAATLADKRLAAYELVTGVDVTPLNGVGVPADRIAFLNATGAWANGAGELGGLNNVDFWVGGLAEKKNEFGGMLGSTFNFIFEYQMENLQNGDRFYYLTRTQGLNILNNMEPNTFSDLVMRNTDLGDQYATHLSGALFITPDHIIELDRGIAQTDYSPVDDPLTLFVDESAGIDPLWEGLDPITESILGPKVVRDYTGSTIADGTHDVGGYLRVLGGEHYVLGGTEGNDTLLGDTGIDALWGDGGDDYLNGGTESDDVFGGEGDDVIEDPFGDDVLRGNQGDDVIAAARGADLLFGDEGSDYIIMGQDAAETFGGEGDDFILGGNGKDFILGNEGNDWIEGGGGFETIAGENSELFFNSSIIGHDVAFGQGDETDYDMESGDDIMGSGASVFRYEGMFGFDWAMGKGDFSTTGVNFDFQIPIFTTIPNDILKDRFDQVEAASGWEYNDYLQGDDRGHKGGGSSAPDSVPTELFAEHLLTQEGINRINGFNDWFGGFDGTDARQTLFGGASPVPGSTPASTFRDGNILMGGNGDDILRGRGGYDLMDGDAYLNVRIKIVILTGPNVGTYSAESLSTDKAAMGQFAGLVFNTNTDGMPDFTSPAFGGRSLNSLMLDRTIKPGEMSIVREILTDATPDDNIDTAIFQGTREEYDIEGITQVANLNGAAPDTLAYVGTASDLDGDGFISVRDRDTGAIGATVWRIIDGVATQVALSSSRGLLTDDRDLIKNVEQLQFADEMVTIGGSNNLATGTVTIGDATPYDGKVTPYVGQVLTATLTNFGDLDGIPLDANGLPVGLSFIWQTTEVGGNSGWSDIQTSLTYTVRSVDPGHILRAVAVFKDANGHGERILSAPTDNPTVAFRTPENKLGLANGATIADAVVGLQIPFNVDYDSESINGAPPVDVDITTLYHEIDPANTAGGRFTVVLNGVDFNDKPRYSIVIDNGGSQLLNYEAPVHTPANQSHQFVDNQYQIVVNTYSDTPANGGVLVAIRQFTILLDDVTGEIVSAAPTVDLTGEHTVITTTNFTENFASTSYTDTDVGDPGLADNWTQDWTEIGDNGGAGGNITITGGVLQFNDGVVSGESLSRAVNLTGASSATLSFTWSENGADADENVLVQAFNGTTWDTLGILAGDTNTNAGGSPTFTLSPSQIGAHSAIRFQSSGGLTIGETFSIDSVVVARNVTTIVPAAPGNDFATTYTENTAAVAIAQGPVVADVDSALIMGATVRLSNAQAGDVLAIAGALPFGVTSSFGPAVAGQITLYLSGPASAAAFQTAIGQVRFGNPAENSVTSGARTITVSVNDGEKESNVATATVTVAGVDDATVANADSIITNIAVGTEFEVPEWALLVNDVDLDNTLDVTAVFNLTGLTATLDVGSVTVTDGVAAGVHQFTYTAGGSPTPINTVATVTSVAPLTSATLSETFDSASYTNNDGAWTDNWVESGDDGFSTAGGGQIRINDGQLRFDSGSSVAASNGASILRSIANLAGATSATLSYAYTENIDPNESVLVEFSADGTTWTTVQNITEASNSGSITNFALTGPFTANAALRFTTSAMSLDADVVTIDNISIDFIAPTTVTGNGSANILIGDVNSSGFNGAGGNDIIIAGLGNDTVLGGAGNDTIVWNANASGATDGRDIVDGGANSDTYRVSGNSTNEIFRIYTRDAFLAINAAAVLALGTEIVITRNGTDAASIIAELDNVEEIDVNTLAVSANDGNGVANSGPTLGDTVEVFGDFNTTSLNFSTITIGGTTGNDTVNIAGLTSEHRIVFNTNGAGDQVIGDLRPQDVVNTGASSSSGTPPTASTDDQVLNDIWAGRRANVLQGTDGDDVFHFASVKAARGDTIMSFQPGDKIDLSDIDAMAGARGDQAFTLVTGGLHERGDLMVTEDMRDDGIYTVISGNAYGDAQADFKISIKGAHDLTATDFNL